MTSRLLPALSLAGLVLAGYVLAQRPTEAAAPPRPKWEYTSTIIAAIGQPDEIHKQKRDLMKMLDGVNRLALNSNNSILNSFGEEGWEVIGIDPGQEDTVVYFKRAKR